MRYSAYPSAVKLTWRHFATSLLHILKGSQIIESAPVQSRLMGYALRAERRALDNVPGAPHRGYCREPLPP
jgi:hypothetical protein